MRIEENKVYVFTFNTGEHGDLSIPVRGESREQAAQNLQDMFARMQTELAMEFPKTQAGPLAKQAEEPVMTAAGGIPFDVLEMRIDTLLGDLGAKGLEGEARATTIKEWTGIDFAPGNFTAIITDLELIASGQKEVPVKSKKK